MARVKVCPVCGKENKKQAIACIECKASLFNIHPTDPADEKLQESQDENNVDEVKVTESSQAEKLCPNPDCQMPLIADEIYCQYCNRPIEFESLADIQRFDTCSPVFQLKVGDYSFPISDCQFLVGRDEQHSPLAPYIPKAFDNVSRRHAELWVENDSLYVRDLNSTNGTFVNGQSIAPDTKKDLKEGDRVRFAADFEVRIEIVHD